MRTLATLLAAASLFCGLAAAQIRTDSSLGRAAQSLTGPQFLVPETLGSLRGTNLFHSFSTFNIASGQSATFTTSTHGIANVVSRVTGGDASLINGALRLEPADGAPGFFFINPAGVTFGAGASIDVPGAFHVSTADYVKFSDGAFHANLDAQSTLSSAPPEAFGFLGTSRAAINVNGGARLNAAPLQPFSIVAGDISMDNGRAVTQGGDIRVVALGAQRREVAFTGDPGVGEGSLRIVNGSTISAPAAGDTPGGNVRVSAGDIAIDRQSSTSTTGIVSQANTGSRANAGSVIVAASGRLSVLNGGVISSSTFASGDAGSVDVSAAEILLQRGASPVSTGIFSSASTGSTGEAGNVDVQVSGSMSVLGGSISSSTFSVGNAGRVQVRTGTLLLDALGRNDVSGIFSQANPGSSGNAGSVDIAATGDISLSRGAFISSSTFGAGSAGSVRVSGADVTIDRAGQGTVTGVFSNANQGTGNAGSVVVEASGRLSVLEGAVIVSNTYTSGNAGSVQVSAVDIAMDGRGNPRDFTTIASNAYAGSSGRAGTVDVAASGELSIRAGATISSSAFASGDAGSVSVDADRIFIDALDYHAFATGIFSVAQSGTGNAGTVSVTARDVFLHGGGSIASNTFSGGNAGSVRVVADTIRVDGGDYGFGQIASSAQRESSGDAGTVDVTARTSLLVVSGGGIASSAFSSGAAGSVRVRGGDLTIDGRNVEGAGIYSQANEGTGNGGTVDVSASGTLSILGNAVISSSTFSSGSAGGVKVNAASIVIDGTGGGDTATGITSSAYDGTGNAGPVRVTTAGSLTIVNGGEISSLTQTSGRAGSIDIEAGSMTVDGRGNFGGVYGQSSGSGDAGSVRVQVGGTLSIVDKGLISSSAFSSGNAGSVHVEASDISIVGRSDLDFATGIISQADRGSTGNAGSVEVIARNSLSIANRGQITSSTFAEGNAGVVRVTAGSLSIDGGEENVGLTGIASQAESSSSGQAGSVFVAVSDLLSIRAGGAISSSTFSTGNAGTVQVDAGRIVLGDPRSDTEAGIFSRAYGGSLGNAGNVSVIARGSLSIQSAGSISSDTFAEGNAGAVTVAAAEALIDGGGFTAGITSVAYGGNAGSIDLRVAGDLTLRDGGQVSTSTFSDGNAGAIRITAGNVMIRNQPLGFSRADTTGVFSLAQYDTGGNAGTIDITTPGTLSLIGGGLIDSTTRSFGHGGSIRVRAGDIVIDGLLDGQPSFRNTGIYSRAEFGEGFAGTVDVAATGSILINYGGLITSDSFSLGDAGSVKVSAANIAIAGGEEAFVTGIASRASFGSVGTAGTVDVTATESLRVMSGGQITSSTSSIGPAGSVTVHAGSVLVDGSLGPGRNSSITARAEEFSRGQTGNVTVIANDVTLSDGGELSITNQGASLRGAAQPSLLLVSAPVVNLVNGGSITAASSFDVAASNIRVNVASRMTLVNSAITTSAVDGNGGSITLNGDGVVVLRDSQITTSVAGTTGNGGDIVIGTRGLVMDTGFIQANTAAPDAAGGNVRIDTAFLIPSGNSLFVGGQAPLEFIPGVFGLNVIQAAAPTGVSGAISITTPSLDISGGLVGLNARLVDSGGLARSLCEMTGGSSLALAGRGGMPPSARDFARVDAIVAATASRLALLDGEASRRISCWR